MGELHFVWIFDSDKDPYPIHKLYQNKSENLFNFIQYKEREIQKNQKKDQSQTWLLQPADEAIAIRTDDLVTIPLLGEGYYNYQKTGKEIRYYSKKGEELWRKKYPYYPVSNYYGDLVLLLAGDGSQVYFMNNSGFLLRETGVHGAYLSDYDFATKSSYAALAFSSGEAYVAGIESIAFSYNARGEEKQFFLKSCALSPYANFLALHFVEGETDFIMILKGGEDGNSEIVRKIKLPNIYPHLLHIAINSWGALVAAPDRTIFISLDGKEDWDKPLACTKNCPIYRPVHAETNFFLSGSSRFWSLIDKKGQVLFKAPVSGQIKKGWRFLPTKKDGVFGIHFGKYIEYFSYKLP